MVAFARQWCDAWNRRDPEWVLERFAEDATFTSPTAARVVPSTGGVVRGKEAIRSYWASALAGNTGLRFELLNVYEGVACVTIRYRTQTGAVVAETLTFRGGSVVHGQAAHEALDNGRA